RSLSVFFMITSVRIIAFQQLSRTGKVQIDRGGENRSVGAVYDRPKSSNANLGRSMTAPTDYFSEREAGDDRPLAGSRRRWRVCGIDKAKARSDSAVDRARSVNR